MASVSLRGVQKAYGSNPPVIRDVDLEIGESEFCVFLGPSGCGKSTLLRMIAGLEDLSDGDLLIGGRVVNDLPAAERGVAMVFQSYALFPHMSVYENMSFGLKLAKKSKAEIDARVREAARVLQLDALLERKPRELSGGQRQRVAIGRAIVREPGVFLFDEPLSNLDATLRGQTRIEIARLHKQYASASVVYVTHDQTEAMTLADKIVLLNAGADTARHGSIAQVGAPLELYHRPASRFVAGFIGSPRMNFLAATVSAIDAQGVTATLVQTGEAVRVAVDGNGLQENEPVTVGVRPEHLELSAGDAPDAGGTLTRTVTLTEHLGEHSYVHLEQPDSGVLIAKVPGNVRIDRGQPVSFVARPDVCHLFTADDFSVKPLAAVAHTV
ncbi:sugar ABC transporter ATP-binding protein [Caballeronia arvi]|uniref:Sugar ABC transporter ATP-binding protein n=1 Tax=Caballeronia arvi TaxID=1777135 RepID=A0A158L054_9BURK|nr:sn-glycerol-3-phosphate ABC transporter ATP-binding protein UgpC [Caballeronia arvi]SAL86230.1 sugar ABC transporter ATP-binding protein [Caballeronia arvi]